MVCDDLREIKVLTIGQQRRLKYLYRPPIPKRIKAGSIHKLQRIRPFWVKNTKGESWEDLRKKFTF